MLRKILFFLLFANMSVYAQKIGTDYECFDINITEIGVDTEFVRDQNDPDTYIVCEGIPVTVTPNFQTQYLRRTDVYDVEPIDHDANTFPLDPAINGGTELGNPNGQGGDFVDCRAECPIELPFKFSYFNKTYERIYVWANGAVTFTDETDCSPSPYVSYVPNGNGLGGPFNGPIPGSMANANLLNSIFGSYQHTHWTRTA